VSDIRDIKHTVQIHTNSTVAGCQLCGAHLYDGNGSPVAPAINHMLDHGYRILHIGGEWARDGEGNSIQHTVVILGTTNIPEALQAAPKRRL